MAIDIPGKLNYWTLFKYKNLFGLFSSKVETCRTWKINVSNNLSFSTKSCWGYTTTFQRQPTHTHCLSVFDHFVGLTLKGVILIPLFCIDLSTKSYRGLWFNQTHLALFQNMPLKIYSNLFLSLRGYNFKINYSKDKLRHGMWVPTLLNNLASSS